MNETRKAQAPCLHGQTGSTREVPEVKLVR